MLREANSLRCSKLSCYAEFNRMVQAIVRNASSTTFTTMPGLQAMQGTSAEYCFYHTLVALLHDVASNTNPSAQRKELERVYEWFTVNKPLLGPKTRPRVRKPSIALTSAEFERPQTAPAALNSKDSTAAPPQQRPYSTPVKHRLSFTSSYMSQSLERDLELVGRPLDHLVSPKQGRSSEHRREPVIRQPLATNILIGRPRSHQSCRPLGSARRSQQSPSVVCFPSPNSLSGEPQHTQRPATVDFGTIFTLAPSVAAQMSLDKNAQTEHQAILKQVLSRPSTHITKLMSARGPSTPSDIDLPPSATAHEAGDEDRPVAAVQSAKVNPSHPAMVQDTSDAPLPLEPMGQPSIVEDCTDPGRILSVEIGEVALDAAISQPPSAQCERAHEDVRPKSTTQSKLQSSDEALVVRGIGTCSDQSFRKQGDKRRTHNRQWPSPTKKKQPPSSSTFLTISPLEMPCKEPIHHTEEVQLLATDSSRRHQPSSSISQYVESPIPPSDGAKCTVTENHQKGQSTESLANHPSLKSKARGDAHRDNLCLRSTTPLAVVSLPLSLPSAATFDKDQARVVTQFNPRRRQHVLFPAGFKNNRYRLRTHSPDVMITITTPGETAQP